MVGNHGLQAEVGSLAGAETLALEISSVIIASEIGMRARAYEVLQGTLAVVRIQLEINN